MFVHSTSVKINELYFLISIIMFLSTFKKKLDPVTRILRSISSEIFDSASYVKGNIEPRSSLKIDKGKYILGNHVNSLFTSRSNPPSESLLINSCIGTEALQKFRRCYTLAENTSPVNNS